MSSTSSPAALHALDDILCGALRTGDDVDPRLEADARHADRIADPFLVVDDEFLRDHVQDPLVGGQRNGLRGVHDARHVALRDLLVLDGDHAV